jgi:hypothetical protein
LGGLFGGILKISSSERVVLVFVKLGTPAGINQRSEGAHRRIDDAGQSPGINYHSYRKKNLGRVPLNSNIIESVFLQQLKQVHIQQQFKRQGQ